MSSLLNYSLVMPAILFSEFGREITILKHDNPPTTTNTRFIC